METVLRSVVWLRPSAPIPGRCNRSIVLDPAFFNHLGKGLQLIAHILFFKGKGDLLLAPDSSIESLFWEY